MTLPHTHLEPLGAAAAVDLADLHDPGALEALRDLLAAHGVVVVDGQDLDDGAFAALLRRLGPPAFTAGEVPLPGHPDLNEVSNVGRSTPPRSSWHVDTAYVRHPPAYTALRAVAVPEAGGETLFTDQVAAAATLPADLRRRVEGRRLLHVATGVELGPGDESAAEHPLLRPHPRSGRPALFLDAPARCAAVSGLDEAAAGDLVAELLAWSTDPARVLRVGWRPGRVVIWDNAVVLHKADHTGVVGDRVLHRGMVADHGVPAA